AGADPEATVDLRAGSVCLEVRRLGDEVIWRTLPAADHAFRSMLAAAETLGRAAHAALATDQGFDLVGAVHAIFAEGLVTGFEGAPCACAGPGGFPSRGVTRLF